VAALLLLLEELCVVVLFVRGVLYLFDAGVDVDVETRELVLLFTVLPLWLEREVVLDGVAVVPRELDDVAAERV